MNMILDLVVLIIPTFIYFSKDTAPKTRVGIIGLVLMGSM